MPVDIKIPSVGESVQEALLAEWFKQDGDQVKKDDVLFVIETDKVTLEITAETSGKLHILTKAGETVAVGAVVARIEASEAGDAKAAAAAPKKKAEPEATDDTPVDAEKDSTAEPAPPTRPPESSSPARETPAEDVSAAEEKPTGERPSMALAPSVRRLVAENQVDINQIKGTGPDGRITKGDVLLYLENEPARATPSELPTSDQAGTGGAPGAQDNSDSSAEVRKPMTPIRKRIAARLLEARQNTAMLTTFNDIDMSRTMALRQEHKERFKEKYGVSLGFMSFFVKACVMGLQEIPEINAFIEGEEIVYHRYQHIGIAIGSQRGLVVPVIRHAERLSFWEIEKAIGDYVAKINNNKLELGDLEGGTFSVSNGGVYGSLLSTPILNTPQSGILGMHRIEKRPVVVGEDQIVVRPMMYVALSYDHRIVDGRGAVTFLKRVKELVENPERLLLEV